MKYAKYILISFFLILFVLIFRPVPMVGEEECLVVKGKVVDINHKDFYRAPFVEFTTLEGEKITFLSPLDVNVDMFQYEIGQEVEVIYNKDNPKHAQINAFWERNTAQMYLGFLGIFLMIFGLLFRRGMKRKAKRWKEKYG